MKTKTVSESEEGGLFEAGACTRMDRHPSGDAAIIQDGIVFRIRARSDYEASVMASDALWQATRCYCPVWLKRLSTQRVRTPKVIDCARHLQRLKAARASRRGAGVMDGD